MMKFWIVNDSAYGEDTAFKSKREAIEHIKSTYTHEGECKLISMDIDVNADSIIALLGGGGYARNMKHQDSIVSRHLKKGFP